MTVRAIHLLQRVLLVCSYWLYRLLSRHGGKTIAWVVGVDEIASMAFHIACAIPNSHSVALSAHKYYGFRYDTELRPAPSPTLALFTRAVAGPIILGRLLNKTQGFLYLGATGFLLADVDQRSFEFAFLKSKGARIACYFVGDDIRSPRLMHQLEKNTGLKNVSTYVGQVAEVFETQAYDNRKRAIARVADRFADVIFTAPTDQLSYLTRATERVLYLYPDEEFSSGDNKFTDLSRIVVLHAPSSPALKGTPLVRGAVERLRSDGYEFEYVELTAASNETVLRELRRAHIVLNQFYAFMPGIFGIEAMAARCAVLMSADERIEVTLPAGSNQAWLVTKNDEVYENLKILLDHPDTIAPLADRGQQWARQYAAVSRSGPKLRAILESVLDKRDESRRGYRHSANETN